jgi:glycosyltransferase involved in cell wall biosynthesis
MRPRIFIAIHYLHLGGAETSLIGLLQSLDPQKEDVDLFVYSHEGEMMQLIPSYVNLLPEDSAWSMFEKPLKEVLKKGNWRMFLARMWAKFRMRQYVRCTNPTDGSAIMGYLGEEVSKVLPGLHHYGVYDLAISFLTPHNFVLNHVTAKKKVCWIHTDYTHIDVNADLELPVWGAYDHVISISEDVTKTFLQVFPSLKDKIVEIENILSPDYVRQRSLLISPEDIQKEMPVRGDCINLLTIGRFSEAKKLDEIPAICRGIVETGMNVRWYIIGYGGSDDYIRREIESEGMQEHVFLLGKKENPYPYIKACDWYVQPSRYEGKSVVVREAQILCKPVIVTNYPTAPSQIQQGVDGVIVPMDILGCVAQMVGTLKNDKLKCSIVEYLEVHDYGNMGEVEKVYALINN